MFTEDWIIANTYSTPSEAELARLCLLSNGIDSYVGNTATQQWIGMGAAIPCSLHVKASDIVRARELLKELYETPTDPSDETYSPKFARKRTMAKILFVSIFVVPFVYALLAKFLNK